MTDKEKRELKDGVISVFKRFNIHDHTATIGGLRDDILRYIDSEQEEPETKFKIGDRIRLKGTTVKGDTIIKIYTSEVGNTYFEFKNSDIASADLDWELVEEPKKCMFTKEEFTKGDRKILCEDCEEECEYAKKEEPVSEDLVKVDVPQEDTEEWIYDNKMINVPDVLNPVYQCFFIKEKATDKRWVYSRRRADVNSEWGEWKKYLYDYE